MYGLPFDTDLGFLQDAPLIQVCAGENEMILNLHPNISIMIASSVRITAPRESESAFDDARDIASAMLPLVGSRVTDIAIIPPGTSRLSWSSGHVLDIVDSWREFESYIVSHGDETIVV